MGMRGSECFNLTYYEISNADMPVHEATWQHFINQGQFEGRPFRYSSVINSNNKYDYNWHYRHFFLPLCKHAQWGISWVIKSCVCSTIKHYDLQFTVEMGNLTCRFTCENKYVHPASIVLQRATDIARKSIDGALHPI